jgi:hypothetical protein
MTRYEMAVLIARLTAGGEVKEDGQKENLQMLQDEFSAEIKQLGYRLQRIETRQRNRLSFHGRLDLRYQNKSFKEPTRPNTASSTLNNLEDKHSGDYRLRLTAEARVDSKTSFNLRFTTFAPDAGNLVNTQGWKDGADITSQEAGIDHLYLKTKVGLVDLVAGKQPLGTDPYDMIVDSDFFSFAGIRAGGKIGGIYLAAQYGRMANGVNINENVPTNTSASNNAVRNVRFTDGNINLLSFALSSTADSKFNYTLGYAAFKQVNDDAAANLNSYDTNAADNTPQGKQDMFKYVYANVGYAFDDQFYIGGQWGKNSVRNALGNRRAGTLPSNVTDPTDVKGGAFYSIKAIWGYRDLDRRGKQNLTLQYFKAEENSLFTPFTSVDSPGFNYRAGNPITATGAQERRVAGSMYLDGWTTVNLSYNYAFSPKLHGQLLYSLVKDDRQTQYDYNYWQFMLSAMF